MYNNDLSRIDNNYNDTVANDEKELLDKKENLIRSYNKTGLIISMGGWYNKNFGFVMAWVGQSKNTLIVFIYERGIMLKLSYNGNIVYRKSANFNDIN